MNHSGAIKLTSFRTYYSNHLLSQRSCLCSYEISGFFSQREEYTHEWRDGKTRGEEMRPSMFAANGKNCGKHTHWQSSAHSDRNSKAVTHTRHAIPLFFCPYCNSIGVNRWHTHTIAYHYPGCCHGGIKACKGHMRTNSKPEKNKPHCKIFLYRRGWEKKRGKKRKMEWG